MVARQQFENELNQLHSKIVSMGVAVEDAISEALTALVDQDSTLAVQIIKNDDIVDDMEREIEKACLEIIVKQQPVARDLRDVTSALKLITDLERIADHASDISMRILSLSSGDQVMIPHDMIKMGEIGKEMIRGSLDSYVTRDTARAQSVIDLDDEVDRLYFKVKADLIHLMTVDAGKIDKYVELMLICKYLERIADHAQNVAEWVVFFVEGEHPQEDDHHDKKPLE